MALERPQGAIRFMFWFKMQHYSCDFAPISAIQIRIEQAQILDEMFLVVSGKYGIGGRGISDIGLKRCRLHGVLATGCRRSTVLWLLGILMTAKRRACQHADAEPRGHPATIPTIQTATAQMNSREEVASDFISTG
jgi:hypothetical protein